MTIAPCKNCKSRYSRCHTTCDIYIDYEIEHREEKERIAKAKAESSLYYGKAEWTDGQRRSWRNNLKR